jgi:hypothetical protein
LNTLEGNPVQLGKEVGELRSDGGRQRTEDGGLKMEGRKKKLRSQRSEVGMEKSWWLISR